MNFLFGFFWEGEELSWVLWVWGFVPLFERGQEREAHEGRECDQFIAALESIPRSTATEIKICCTIILQLKLLE